MIQNEKEAMKVTFERAAEEDGEIKQKWKTDTSILHGGLEESVKKKSSTWSGQVNQVGVEQVSLG